MPYAAPRKCAHPGCRTLVRQGKCDKHRTQSAREDIARRGTASSRGYGSRWTKARTSYLAKHPLCVECGREGRLTRATVVDHITPWRSGATQDEQQRLFWDVSGNWRPLCAACHGRIGQKTARNGAVVGMGTQRAIDPPRGGGSISAGWPVEPRRAPSTHADSVGFSGSPPNATCDKVRADGVGP